MYRNFNKRIKHPRLHYFKNKFLEGVCYFHIRICITYFWKTDSFYKFYLIVYSTLPIKGLKTKNIYKQLIASKIFK